MDSGWHEISRAVAESLAVDARSKIHDPGSIALRAVCTLLPDFPELLVRLFRECQVLVRNKVFLDPVAKLPAGVGSASHSDRDLRSLQATKSAEQV